MSQQKKKILIVEDDDILSSTLKDNLILEGFDVSLAKDGEEGLTSALNIKPDLILLDILLPKMDGFTVLKRLREDEAGKHFPVIILTNLSSPEDISQAINAMDGLKEYLVKVNWSIADVLKKIKEKLS